MRETPSVNVLPYATTARESYRRINLVVAVGSGLLLAGFYIGLAPSVGGFAFDYTKRIPIWEAVTGVVRVSPWEVLNDFHTQRLVWFLPIGMMVAVSFVLGRWRRAKLVISVAAVVLPLVVIGRAFGRIVLLPFLVPQFMGALIGLADGEDWSEGMIAMGAMGAWMIFWSLIIVALTINVIRTRGAVKAENQN
jgi:hypothetical protein